MKVIPKQHTCCGFSLLRESERNVSPWRWGRVWTGGRGGVPLLQRGECVWEGSVGVNMGITSWHLPFWRALCPLAYRGLRAVASIVVLRAGGWALGRYGGKYLSSLAGLLFLFRRRCWGLGAGTVVREVFVISRGFIHCKNI